MEVFMSIHNALQRRESQENRYFANFIADDFLTHFSNVLEMPILEIPSLGRPVVVRYPVEAKKVDRAVMKVFAKLDEIFDEFATRAGNESFAHTVNWEESHSIDQEDGSKHSLEIRAWLKGPNESSEKKVST